MKAGEILRLSDHVEYITTWDDPGLQGNIVGKFTCNDFCISLEQEFDDGVCTFIKVLVDGNAVWLDKDYLRSF
jgi:hypothetical protein